MKGLPYFPTDSSYAGDPRLLALAKKLKEPLAEAYWFRLRGYCFQQEQDRFAADGAAETVEHAVRWPGPARKLFNALVAVGLLERNGDEVVVAGVHGDLERALHQRRGNAERQQRKRAAEEASRKGLFTVGERTVHSERVKRRDSGTLHSEGLGPNVTRDVTRASQGRVEERKGDERIEPSPRLPAAAGGPPVSLQGHEAVAHSEVGTAPFTTAHVLATFAAEYEREKKTTYVPEGREYAAAKKIAERSDATALEVKLRCRRGLRSTGFERGCTSLVDVERKWLALTRDEGKFTGSKWAAGGQRLDGCSDCGEKPCVCEVEKEISQRAKVYAPISDFSKPGADKW